MNYIIIFFALYLQSATNVCPCFFLRFSTVLEVFKCQCPLAKDEGHSEALGELYAGPSHPTSDRLAAMYAADICLVSVGVRSSCQLIS